MEEFFTSIDYVSLFQLLIAMLLGMLLGAERTMSHKTAGLRTYGLVSMGAALFVIVARSVLVELSEVSSPDAMRVIAGVVTGVGFLGAGVIILRENTLVGLTTAAGLWVAAGLGVAVAFEMYVLALFASLLTLLAFTVFWRVEKEVEEIREDNTS